MPSGALLRLCPTLVGPPRPEGRLPPKPAPGPAYRFKVAKDQPSKAEPAEYRREDFDRIVGMLRSQHGAEWRASVALLIIGKQGVRQNAALHLTWAAVDFLHGRLTWQASFDKNGRTWTQPMRLETYVALLTARWWRNRLGYTGPWVLPPARVRNTGPYTAQSLWHQQTRAERLAGVPHLELRAAHGLRRMVVNDILTETSGDMEAAAQFIGDKDLQIVRGSYRRTREDELVALADRLDATLTGPQPIEPAPVGGSDELVATGPSESHRSDLNRRPLDYESRALPLSYGGVVLRQRVTASVERSTPWCQWWCQNPPRGAPPTGLLT